MLVMIEVVNPVQLPTLPGKPKADYKVGKHHIDDSILNGKHCLRYLSSGDIKLLKGKEAKLMPSEKLAPVRIQGEIAAKVDDPIVKTADDLAAQAYLAEGEKVKEEVKKPVKAVTKVKPAVEKVIEKKKDVAAVDTKIFGKSITKPAVVAKKKINRRA